MATTESGDALARVRALARILDSAFRVPGTNVRFGLDPVIGLVPGLGDAIGVAASAYIVLESVRLGVPGAVLLRMLANVGIEGLIGAVPLVGDVFDVAWRANDRNVQLLDQCVTAPTQTGAASRRLLIGAAVGLTVIGAGVAVLAGVVVWALASRLW